MYLFVLNNLKLSNSKKSLNVFENFTATDIDVNRCGKLKGRVMMSIAEVVEKLENFSATPLVAILDRINRKNNTTKGLRLYRDDCGAWHRSSPTALYLKQSSKQQLQKIALLNQNKKLMQVLKQFVPYLGIKTSLLCISTIAM